MFLGIPESDYETPEVTLGSIVRDYFGELNANHALSKEHRKALHAMSICRTQPLGTHEYECGECGEVVPLYNSCRNRHCPQCQGISQRIWVEKQLQKLLPVPYFHITFTIPDVFNPFIPYNEKLIYGILFSSMWHAIRKVCNQDLGGTPGVTAVLHTWGQTLCRHPHLHCLVTGGVLSHNERSWHSCSSTYFVDVRKLSAEFNASFCRRIMRAYRRGEIQFGPQTEHLHEATIFAQFIDQQQEKDWAVHCKKPFAGPQQVIEYIGRYTHRVGIGNSRILAVANNEVTFDYKDYRDLDEDGVPVHKTMTIPAVDFLKRFLMHVLPDGFRKIRHYGILAGELSQDRIEHCRRLLQVTAEELEKLLKLPEFAPECPCCGFPLERCEIVSHHANAPPAMYLVGVPTTYAC